jgi:quinol monooxygenase YgiN
MHILIITFQLNGLDADTYAAHCAERAPHFAALPGLVAKFWLANPATNTYGGVYIWESLAAMKAYCVSETYYALRANPAFTNINAQAFDTLAEATAHTAGHLAYSPLPIAI